jgi:predicted phosphatase
VLFTPRIDHLRSLRQATEIISGVPQIVYKLPLDATVITALADLDVSSIFDRLIIGPSQYPWVMYTAFVKALTEAGIQDAKTRVWRSEIPIRS